MLSPVILDMNINPELNDNPNALEYVERMRCGIMGGPCPFIVDEE